MEKNPDFLNNLNLSPKLRSDIQSSQGFWTSYQAILSHQRYQEMRKYRHHGQVDCFSHSVHVGYLAYQVAIQRRLREKPMVVGALLHDFYLYDWHIKGDRKGLHGVTHPRCAYQNAQAFFSLGPIEEDIIKKHMWPLTLAHPKYLESTWVMWIDKYCSLIEYFT